MMKFILILSVLLTSLIAAEAKLELTIESKHVFGKHSVFFESITSVCEDDNNNLFVLDSRAHKIYKFSKTGKKTAVFGDKGLGPADMNRPHNIYFNSHGELVVNEITGVVSYFDSDGKFLKKTRVARGVNIISLDEHLYYAWIWDEKVKKQVLLDENGRVLKSFFEIPKDAFSINLPDETGRYVMFNYFSDSYTPFFVFNHYKGLSAIAVSDRYEIILINNDGSINRTIRRNIKPPVISSLEREYLEAKIKNYKKFPSYVKKKLCAKIPKQKNFLNFVLISSQYIWVFRPKRDLTRADELILVDLYNLDGTSKGSLAIKNLPCFISDKFMYFEETDADDNLLLVKCKYSVGALGRKSATKLVP